MFELITIVSLLIIGFTAGRINERNHFTRIRVSESELGGIIATNLKTPPDGFSGTGEYVTGSVVVALDYFKVFITSFRLIVGGRVNAYMPLMERARREAIIRMKQQAQDLGAEAVCNVRLQTSRIAEHTKGIGAIEIHAFGTALIPQGARRG